MKSFSFILGGWAPNIGNAFFQLGGLHSLKTLFPDARFVFISEQPGYPSYWNPKGGNPANYFDMATAVSSEYIVLMGPLFRPETEKIWGPSLSKIMKKGTKLILLGAAAMKYESANIEKYRSFLKRFPPYLMTTRDSDTYDCLGDMAQHAYNGIDFAFYTSDYYSLGGLDNYPPYVALSFDKYPEPRINIYQDSNDVPERLKDALSFEFRNETWVLENRALRTKFAKKSRYLMLLEGLLFAGEKAVKIGNYNIVRTDHRTNPIFSRKTFRSPNTMVNDTPFPYYEIYGNASLTLSNRIHACVIALTYGKPAMLFSESPRIRLLERVGLQNITKQPMTLDPSMLASEKKNLLDFLKNHL